jgi:soluble lytic murein transglycosylase-like protein
MQIKLQAAQIVGYQGSAEGLLDADTNLRYGMRFLGRVYQMAKGDACRTIAIYRSGNPASTGDQAYCAKAFRDEASKEPAGKTTPVQTVASPG